MNRKKFYFIGTALTAIFLCFSVGLFAQFDSAKISAAIKTGAFLVDVRTPQEFADSSVSGAINIPLDDVSNQLAMFKDKKEILVFCKSGNRSSKAIKILKENGFTNLINGGSWQNVRDIKEKAMATKGKGCGMDCCKEKM